MTKQSDKIFLSLVIAMWVLSAIYFIDCLFNTIENLELIGASMLAFKPSFTISNIRDTRRYSDSDRLRNYVGLHTPIYRAVSYTHLTLPTTPYV